MRRRLLYQNVAPTPPSYTVNWYFENRHGQTVNYCSVELYRQVNGVTVEETIISIGGGIAVGSNRTGTINVKELTGRWTQKLISADPVELKITFFAGQAGVTSIDVTSQLNMYGYVGIEWK